MDLTEDGIDRIKAAFKKRQEKAIERALKDARERAT